MEAFHGFTNLSHRDETVEGHREPQIKFLVSLRPVTYTIHYFDKKFKPNTIFLCYIGEKTNFSHEVYPKRVIIGPNNVLT